MKRIAAIFILAGSFFPEIAEAAPVYLSCSFPDTHGSTEVMDFTVNEADGTVAMYIRRNGYSKTHSATFTADKVIFGANDDKWIIDRKNLKISEDVMFDNKHLGLTYGQCEINPTPNRAF